MRRAARMAIMWWPWLLGAVILIAAGLAAAALPRLRAADLRRRAAWSAARSAIDTAAISRDASAGRVGEAEDLLSRAEALAAHRGGVRAAEEAGRLAARADLMWREAAGG